MALNRVGGEDVTQRSGPLYSATRSRGMVRAVNPEKIDLRQRHSLASFRQRRGGAVLRTICDDQLEACRCFGYALLYFHQILESRAYILFGKFGDIIRVFLYGLRLPAFPASKAAVLACSC